MGVGQRTTGSNIYIFMFTFYFHLCLRENTVFVAFGRTWPVEQETHLLCFSLPVSGQEAAGPGRDGWPWPWLRWRPPLPGRGEGPSALGGGQMGLALGSFRKPHSTINWQRSSLTGQGDRGPSSVPRSLSQCPSDTC